MRAGRVRAFVVPVALLGAAAVAAGGSAPLRVAARLPGPAGRAALVRLVRRGDAEGTRRALALLADGSAEAATRVAVARAFAERGSAEALPALLAALNGTPVEVAAAASGALASFDRAGRAFGSNDAPEARARVVLEWNAWWRGRQSGPPHPSPFADADRAASGAAGASGAGSEATR